MVRILIVTTTYYYILIVTVLYYPRLVGAALAHQGLAVVRLQLGVRALLYHFLTVTTLSDLVEASAP